MTAPPAGPTMSMTAAVYKRAGEISVEDVPVPAVGPTEALIEVSHCGICGTDLHMVVEGWGTPGSIDGHEYSGVLVAVGEDAGAWSVGDRVVGGPSRGCGACPFCAGGRPNLCTNRARIGIDPYSGAFARYKLLDVASLYRVPDGLDLRTAALTEPLAVALRGVRRGGLRAGQRALVTGGGPIGLLTAVVLADAGAGEIVVSEPVASRQRLARAAGATRVVTPDDLPMPALPMEVVAEPFALAVECSGRPNAAEAALANLDRAGTLVLSGTGMRRPRFDTNRIILNELTVTGTVEYSPSEFEEAIEMLAEGRVPAAALLEPDDVSLAGLGDAMARLASGEIAGKVLVRPR